MTVRLAMVEGVALSAAVLVTSVTTSPVPTGPAPVAIGAAVVGCCLLAFFYGGLYDRPLVGSFSRFLLRLPLALVMALGFLLSLCLVLRRLRMSPASYLPLFLAVVAVLLVTRSLAYGMMRSLRFGERVLVLGACPLAQKIVAEIESQPHLRQVVTGIVDDGPLPGALAHHRHLGAVADLGPIIERVGPDRIVVTPAARRSRLPVEPLLEHRVRGVVVEDGVDAFEQLTGKLAIESLTAKSLIFGTGFRRARVSRAVRRALSLTVSVASLLVLLPLLALIALAIRLDSAGPVLFIQDRVGQAGRRFRLFKFRTMRPGGETTSEWARDNDDRITRVGRVLRKYRLDELPQFFNVVRGDMNLVGPRPHPVSNFQLFVQNIPYYSLRSVVPPGITGWAQVRYSYANNLEEETEKMRYDLYYIKHTSLWLDLLILSDTVKIVLLGRESVPDAHQVAGERREDSAPRMAAHAAVREAAHSVSALLAGESGAREGSSVIDGLKAD
jgi:exopolysaccharide biosynthesis polyprenyl glycosylphosphotransferase